MDSTHRRLSRPNEYEHESPLSSSKRAERVDLGGVGIGWNMEKKHQLVQGGFPLRNTEYKGAVDKAVQNNK